MIRSPACCEVALYALKLISILALADFSDSQGAAPEFSYINLLARPAWQHKEMRLHAHTCACYDRYANEAHAVLYIYSLPFSGGTLKDSSDTLWCTSDCSIRHIGF